MEHEKKEEEQMNIVIVGHVDHGKSTVIGRLLAETGSLPEGKLDQIKNSCKKASKEFEYAFLLDALHDEQDQGITIDSARIFFNTKKRNYIIIDAPGHIEFLKNMISGAARAEAALLVIDAEEGIQENSKRHAYMLSMLGIKQVSVIVNKMDLVDYKEDVYNKITNDFTLFLNQIGIKPTSFLPVSAREGDNIHEKSTNMKWFKGMTVLETLDSFTKEKKQSNKPARMPVQDVYKFTGMGDKRRIISGRVESGTFVKGDKVIFLPSNKVSQIASIESMLKNRPEPEYLSAGYSGGVTLTEQLYISRGEIMCREDDLLPETAIVFEANIFWMARKSLTEGKEYKLKIGTQSIPVTVEEIKNVLDASNLGFAKRKSVKRHEIAVCRFRAEKPIAYDLVDNLQVTSRFVLIDDYDISGGGIISNSIVDEQGIIKKQVLLRQQRWQDSEIDIMKRSERYAQKPTLILITGPKGKDKVSIAKDLERMLFNSGRLPYFLGIGNLLRGVDADITAIDRNEHIRRLGEVGYILIDSGLIVIATASDLNESNLEMLKTIVTQEMTLISLEQDLEYADLSLIESDGSEYNAVKVIDLLKHKGIIFNI